MMKPRTRFPPRFPPGFIPLLLAASIIALSHAPIIHAQTDAGSLLPQLEADFMVYWPEIASFEDDYQKLHGGRYFQALDSHTVVPKDGIAETADKLQASPTDQAEKLDLLWIVTALPSKLPYSFRIDVYDGPSGAGYVVTLAAEIDKQLWERSINAGPERWRDQDWHEMKPEAP